MTVMAVKQARRLLLSQDVAMLSTHSSDCPGYPFGSIVPVGFDEFNRPVLLISRLAQHTRNIAENPSVSLLLSDVAQLGNQDVQTCARIAVLGEMQTLEGDQGARTIARYQCFYPQAEDYCQALDFDFYRLEPEKVRFIAGFGQIHWIEPEKLFTASPFSETVETEICAHMNADHPEALLNYCRQGGIELPQAAQPLMVGVDAFGFHQRIGERIYRFEFPEPVGTANEVRQALIAMLKH